MKLYLVKIHALYETDVYNWNFLILEISKKDLLKNCFLRS